MANEQIFRDNAREHENSSRNVSLLPNKRVKFREPLVEDSKSRSMVRLSGNLKKKKS